MATNNARLIAEYLTDAKAMVSDIYPRVTYAEMKREVTRDTYMTCHGCFRSTIIPTDKPFIIKSAIRKGGVVQCEREAETYFLAEEAGLASYFAKYYGCFTYHRHKFYVFEKIAEVGEGLSGDYYVRYNKTITDYGKKKGLLKFLDDNYINDLHAGNYGKRGRTYVLTDYAGCRYEEW